MNRSTLNDMAEYAVVLQFGNNHRGQDMYKLITVREAGDDIGIDFDLEIDGGKIQHFQVSSEAIEDLVRAPQKLHGTELVDAFHQVASRICEVAARKNGTPSNARPVLKTRDF